MFQELDNIDHEAMREGFAISRLKSYSTAPERKRKCSQGKLEKKKEKEVDILQILGVVH